MELSYALYQPDSGGSMQTDGSVTSSSMGQSQVPWPPPARAWALVVLLLMAYALAFIDRQILALLVEPVRRDLAISDTQFSLLAGFAFTLFYAIMAIPCAWLADRGSRRNLVAASLTAWSAMTAACGLAVSFSTLFLARIGVGIGEAGLSPAAYSMIADSFPPAKRARAIGVYSIGAVTGVGLAFVVGGAVAHWATTAPPITLPVLGTLAGWQLAFLIVSIPGPILALCMLAFREPVRHEEARAADSAKGLFGDFLTERGRLLTWLMVGYSLIGVAYISYLMWTPAFMVRRYGWNVAEIGAAFGGIILVCSTSGILLGGWWADRLLARGVRNAFLRVAIIGSLWSVPFAIAAPFAPTGGWALASLAAMSIFFGLTQGMPVASLQAITPNRLRARIVALYLLVANLITFTLAPTGVAVISDYLIKDPTKIGIAVAIMSAVAVPLGALILFLVRSAYYKTISV